MDYSEFEKKLGYEFRDKDLLDLAFTHTTYVFERNVDHCYSNQRLEFIGDAVMDLIVGRKIYELKPFEGEGYLSKIRSITVCESSFAKVARRLEIGKWLKLGKGEESTNGRDKDSTLADAFEAVIAAVYFDGGIDVAEKVILSNLEDIIEDAVAGKIFLDYKSRLFELAQSKNNRHEIRFEILDERGPAHMREFEVAVYADDTLLAKATGGSKKHAEQNCAKEALPVYEELFGFFVIQ
ncbi:MAG: ribonuclease III [Clostridiales bacterium]|nr:ribonuclease III [Clostridiales bacterium]